MLDIYFIEGLIIIEVRHGFGKDHFTSRVLRIDMYLVPLYDQLVFMNCLELEFWRTWYELIVKHLGDKSLETCSRQCGETCKFYKTYNVVVKTKFRDHSENGISSWSRSLDFELDRL